MLTDIVMCFFGALCKSPVESQLGSRLKPGAKT